MKIRIHVESGPRFYYPDASVICESNPHTNSFQDKPDVIIEVISESTRRFDETEKLDAYLSIPSLTHCLLVEQDSVGVVVYQREGDKFERRVFH